MENMAMAGTIKRLGFIGSGTITAAMVRGLKTSNLRDWPILLSPRNAAVAQELATTLPGVSVAADNQNVIDHSDMVFLAVRPQIAEKVIRPLAFRPGQQVVSLIAGLQISTLGDWIAGGTEISRAIPLPFVAERRDATPVFPPSPEVMRVFDAIGTAIAVAEPADFDTYAAASALMGTYFGIVEEVHAWLCEQGLGETDAATYMRSLFSNLGHVLLQQDTMSLSELRIGHSTRGGLNELAYGSYIGAGGGSALREALSSVLKYVHAQKTVDDGETL